MFIGSYFSILYLSVQKVWMTTILQSQQRKTSKHWNDQWKINWTGQGNLCKAWFFLIIHTGHWDLL